MHHKEAAKRHSRRVILTNILVVLTVVLLAGILVLYTMGYRLNRSLTLEQMGLLRVNSLPTGAQVLVDGDPSGKRTAARLELSEGSHRIGVSRAGYDIWERTVAVRAGSVVWLDYVLLLPQQINEELVTKLPEESWSQLARDGAIWVVAADGAPEQWTVVDTARNRVLNIKHGIPVVEGRNETLNLSLIDLSDDGALALVQRESRTAAANRPTQVTTKISYWLVEVSNGRSTELPLLASRAWAEVRFADRTGRSFYLLDQANTLWLYDNKLANERQVATDVARVERRGAQLLYTVRKEDGPYEAWLFDTNNDRRMLMQREEDFSWVVTVYMGDTYIVAADGAKLMAGKITESERRVVAETQFAGLPDLYVAGRMLVATVDGNFVSYDLENEIATLFQPNLTWLGGWLTEGVLYGWNDEQMIVTDFDGYNRRTVVPMQAGSPVVETSGHYLYYLVDGEDDSTEMRRFRL
jgi:hypothetical protein